MAVSKVGIRLSVSGDAQVKGALAGAEKSLAGVQSAAADASQSLRNLAGAFAGAVTVGAFVKAADSVTILNNQLKLATGSADAAATAYASLFDIAQRSRVSFTELGGTFATISRAGQELGLSQQRLLGVTEAIGNAMTISGGSAEGMKAALVQLGQGLASGTLRGEELNSVMEQTPRLAKALADGLGVSTGKLREMGAAGQITAEAVIKALESQSKVLSGEVQGAVLTIGQAFTQLQNASVVAVGEFDKATGASSALAAAITGVATTVGDLGRAFKENEGAITTTLGVLAGGAAAAGAVALAANFGKVTAAVKALGIVLAANPLTLSLLGIGAVVGGFVAYDQAQRKTEEGIRKTIAALEDLNKAPSIYARDAKGIAEWTKASEGRRQEIAKLKQELAGMGAKQETTAEAARLGRQSEAAAQASNANKKLADSYAEIQTRLSGFKGDHAKYQADLKTIQELREKGVITEKQSVEMLTELAKKHSEAGKKTKEHGDKYATIRDAMKSWADAVGDFGRIQSEVEGKTVGLTKAQGRLIEYLQSPGYIEASEDARQLALASAYAAIGAEELAEAEKNRIKAMAEAHKAAAAYASDLDRVAMADADVIEMANEYSDSINARIKATEFEAGLIGKSNTERAIAIKQYEVEIDLQKKILDIKKKLANQQEQDDAIAAVTMAANKAKANVAAEVVNEKFQRTSQQIEQSLTDALMRGFESGKDFAKNMRDTVVNMFKTMVLRPVISAIVNPVAGALTGALGLAGNANASTGGIGNITNLFSGGGDMLGSIGSTVFGNSAAYGAALGTTSFGAGSQAAMLAAQTGEFGLAGLTATSGAAGGAMASIGAAMPWIGGALAIASLLKGFDDSGTIHTGGLAQYSAAGGTQTSTQHGAFGMGFGGVDYGQAGTALASGMAQTIVGILDTTATAFGKTAGYTAATAFADDTSKDGAWGGLLIKNAQGNAEVNWNDTRTSRWAPREFSDGEAGAKEYAAAVAKDVRNLLIEQTPEWADTMLNALGDAPTLEQLAATVGQINAAAAAMSSMGKASAAFAGMSESTVSALIAAMGGAEATVANLSGYYANFYTESERATFATAELTDQLADLGQEMPASREAFKGLVDAAIAAGDSTLAAGLINLQDEFAALVPAAEAAATAVASSVKSMDAEAKRLQRQLIEAQGGDLVAFDTEGMSVAERAAYALNQSLQAQIDATNAAKNATDTLADTQQQAADTAQQAAADTLSAWQDAQRKMAQGWLEGAQTLENVRYESAQRELDAARQAASAIATARTSAAQASIEVVRGIADALTNAREALTGAANQPLTATSYRTARGLIDQAAATGNLNQAGLEDALKIVSGNTQSLFGRFEDWAMAQAAAADPVAKLDAQAQGQMTAAQAIIDTMRVQEEEAALRYDENKRVLGDQHSALMDSLQMQYDAQIAQIEATQSVAAAMGPFLSAVTSSASGGGGGRGQTAASELANYAQLTATISGLANQLGITYGQAEVMMQTGQAPSGVGNSSYIGQGLNATAPIGSAQDLINQAAYNAGNKFETTYNPSGGYDLSKTLQGYKDMFPVGSFGSNYSVSGFQSYLNAVGYNAQGPEATELLKTWGAAMGLPAYAVGTPYVPEDGPAYLHKGEMVVPAAYNPNNVGYRQADSNAAVVAELRTLNDRMARVEAATTATAGFTAGTDRKLARVIKADAITTETA